MLLPGAKFIIPGRLKVPGLGEAVGRSLPLRRVQGRLRGVRGTTCNVQGARCKVRRKSRVRGAKGVGNDRIRRGLPYHAGWACPERSRILSEVEGRRSRRAGEGKQALVEPVLSLSKGLSKLSRITSCPWFRLVLRPCWLRLRRSGHGSSMTKKGEPPIVVTPLHCHA